jgi:hypothetical protein
VAVLEVVQLLAVASHQEEGVVDTRAEDEHAEDAGALVVDGEIGILREQVDHALSGGDRADAAQQEQDRQLEAAIGDQQDHEDDPQCGQQHDAVDTGERLHLVGVDGGRAADAHVEAVGAACGLLEIVDDVGEHVPAV